MAIISGMVHLVIAILALVGCAVVAALFYEEVLPTCRFWWQDVQDGHAQYQAIRRERQIKQQAIAAAVRTEEALDLARQRMTMALERSRPLGRPAHRRTALPGQKPEPWV